MNLLWAFWGGCLGLSCAIARCLREGCRDTSWNHSSLLAVQHPRVPPPPSSLLAEALTASRLLGHCEAAPGSACSQNSPYRWKDVFQATQNIAVFLNLLINKFINQLNTHITLHAVRGTNLVWMEIVQSGQGIFYEKEAVGVICFSSWPWETFTYIYFSDLN